MSVNRDMREYILQHNEPTRTPSGAEKANWIEKGRIQVAVYKKNDMKVSASEKYIESTHTGVTRCKDIDSDGYRLVRNGVIYEITDCNTEGRLTNLLLKVVR